MQNISSKARWKYLKSPVALPLLFFLIFSLVLAAAAAGTDDGPVAAGKNILVFVGMTTYSHRMAVWPLLQKLADEGHNVTFFSSHPPKSLADPRIHEVVPPALVQFSKHFLSPDLLNLRLKGKVDTQALWDEFPEVSLKMFQVLVRDKDFLAWYERAEFDLVFLDSLFCDFALGLAYKFKALTAVLATTSPYMWVLDSLGAPVESWVPDLQFAFPENMTFLQRVVNVLKPIYWNILRRWSYFPRLEKLMRENLEGLEHMPSLEVLEKNVSLVLANTHYSEEYARSSPPNLISIGGLHCGHYEEKEDLKELGKFMNASGASTGGFIYVSFGSAAAVSRMPPALRKILFDVMQKAPTNFVLKWEGEIPPNLPKNVFPAHWLPQQSVLGHRNIKGFLTHGGLLGVQEAVCAGVPLIVLPIFAEQDFNANRIERRGTGLKLDWKELSEEVLSGAISKILTDSSYKKNMVKTSRLFHDRQNSPLETASWWVNYILRHGQVDAIQPLGIHQTWYERRMLDVWALILAILVSMAIIVYRFLKFVTRCCRFSFASDAKISRRTMMASSSNHSSSKMNGREKKRN